MATGFPQHSGLLCCLDVWDAGTYETASSYLYAWHKQSAIRRDWAYAFLGDQSFGTWWKTASEFEPVTLSSCSTRIKNCRLRVAKRYLKFLLCGKLPRTRGKKNLSLFMLIMKHLTRSLVLKSILRKKAAGIRESNSQKFWNRREITELFVRKFPYFNKGSCSVFQSIIIWRNLISCAQSIFASLLNKFYFNSSWYK